LFSRFSGQKAAPVFDDKLIFLKQVLQNPAQVSALFPSSRELARVMASTVEPSRGPVAEFGPGTGIITQALLDRGVAPHDLTLMEMSGEFCTLLTQKFPDVTLINRPAQDIVTAGKAGFSTIVSGLPLLSMDASIQRQILTAAFDVLLPNGNFVQFTYGLRPPVAPDVALDLGLTTRKLGWVWQNIPPAHVYIYTRLPH